MYKGHETTISSLKYSPDGLWIASGDEEGSVKVSYYEGKLKGIFHI